MLDCILHTNLALVVKNILLIGIMSAEESIAMDPAQVLEAKEVAKSQIINKTIREGGTPVQGFYSGATIFITGGSGFIGKQLIEKLFRSCHIHKIYLLLRPKKGKSLEVRINDIVKDQLFEYLHKTQPDFVNKLIPVAGDVIQIRLGLNEDTWTTLTKEVNVIFHEAATLNFLEPLKVATLTNVRGTREVMKLGLACNNLKALVYVSTAFSHATAEHLTHPVLETFYKIPLSTELLIQLAEELDGMKLDAITPDLMQGWPNTYTFTKAAAEEIVRAMAGDMPVCIVRPAIVMPAYREPPGYVDKSTMNGTVGVIVGAGLGGLHVMLADKEKNNDMVCVDIVNNATIVAAYETAMRRERGDNDVRIYTVTRSRNPIKIKLLQNFFENGARELNTPLAFWYAYIIITSNKLLFFLLYWLLHYIPGYLVDGILMLMGKRPKAIRLYERAYRQNKVYTFYLTNHWEFGDSNLVEMYKSLSPEDRIIYNCDAASTDPTTQFCNCAIGIRKYLLQDGLQNTEYAIKKTFWFRILNHICLTLYAYCLWKIAYKVLGLLYFVYCIFRF